LSFFRLSRLIHRVGDHKLKPFGVNAHSSHRFGLSARTAPALTSRLPFPPGCVLRLCLLDSKAVIFAYHKLHSRLLAHGKRFKGGRPVYRPAILSHNAAYETGVAAGPRSRWPTGEFVNSAALARER